MLGFVVYDVLDYTFQHDGGTFLLPDMKPLNKTAKVWVLSIDDEHGVEMPIKKFTGTAINMWLMNGNAKRIEQWNGRLTNSGSLKALGTWINDKTVYIDIATIYSKDEFDRETVLEIGRANKQRYIWDNENQVAIETGYMP